MITTIQTKQNRKADIKVGSMTKELKAQMEGAPDFLKDDSVDERCIRFGGIELQKTHFVFHDRTEFKSDHECSVIGHYEVIIPKDNILDLNNMLINCRITESNVLGQIEKSGIGDDVMSLESDENFIRLKCYKGEGDYVEELESIYFYKNQIEHRVELAMAQTNIRKYGLRIEVNTLDF